MFRKVLTKVLRVAVVLAGVGGLIFVGPQLLTRLFFQDQLYSVADAPARRVAIVFGAGLRWDGTPSAVLRDRVRTASELYFAGKADVLLMSGDNRFEDYNEPAAMKAFALSLGVPEEAIVLDFAGRRTYDTCYRARAIFGVTDAILVTQKFHLPRALYTCNALGVSAVGVVAQQSRYWRGALGLWTVREFLATTVAFWDVYVARPVPVLGNPEPIFPLEAQ